MVQGLLAEGPGQVLSIGRWKEQVVAPEFLLDDREDIASNRNAFFYEDKRSFRPEGLGEQVKRITGAEDVGLQPRLVTRVRLHNLQQFLPLPDFLRERATSYTTLSLSQPS
ncbi:phosphoenolpyruvate-protein phosphotransferase [Lasius niger]|uniref:Phosphoenolpyruvate-protein phosphotransferase n=1 Tax=Lasius niger TaxID=67767 RepID=A0A0J7KUD0_LASNI|nr:phosphoenolpyruvate-protein phosphotransferase [Lasius niger]